MSLDLDRRQRAMLAEMHLPVWWPEAVPEPLPEPARPMAKSIAQVMDSVPVLQAARAESSRSIAPGDAETPAVADAASSDWTRLRADWAGVQACVPLNTAPGEPADWLVLGEALGVAEEAHQPFAAPEAQLLANMLQAVGISARPGAASVLLASLLKPRPLDTSEPAADTETLLRRMVALLQPKLILALGPFAAQLLLNDSTPLGQLRGRVHRYHGVPVVVSYHPAMLLRNRPEKAKAWADLCLALSVIA